MIQYKKKIKVVSYNKTRKKRGSHKKRGTEKKGGKVLGRGTTAKVIYPAIPCRGKNTTNYVSKVFFSKNNTVEKKDLETIISRLKSIDPEQKYFIYPEFCDEFGELLENNRENGITNNSKQYSYLMKKGGKPFMRYNNNIHDLINGYNELNKNNENNTREKKEIIDNLVDILKPVINLIYKLHDAGIVHTDLGVGNIIYMTDGTPRLIDFDFAEIIDTKPKSYQDKLKMDDIKVFLEGAIGSDNSPKLYEIFEKQFI